jgi:hypothetical protein
MVRAFHIHPVDCQERSFSLTWGTGGGQQTADGTHPTRTIASGSPSQTRLPQETGLALLQGCAEHQALRIRRLLPLFLRARGEHRQDSARCRPLAAERWRRQSARELALHHRGSRKGPYSSSRASSQEREGVVAGRVSGIGDHSISRAGGGLQGRPQDQPHVPYPLRGDLPQFLSIGRVGTPAIGVLLHVLIG